MLRLVSRELVKASVALKLQFLENTRALRDEQSSAEPGERSNRAVNYALTSRNYTVQSRTRLRRPRQREKRGERKKTGSRDDEEKCNRGVANNHID